MNLRWFSIECQYLCGFCDDEITPKIHKMIKTKSDGGFGEDEDRLWRVERGEPHLLNEKTIPINENNENKEQDERRVLSKPIE